MTMLFIKNFSCIVKKLSEILFLQFQRVDQSHNRSKLFKSLINHFSVGRTGEQGGNLKHILVGFNGNQ